MLQVPVLELGNICLETSTKDQCERHSFEQEITTAREREKKEKVGFHKPGLIE